MPLVDFPRLNIMECIRVTFNVKYWGGNRNGNKHDTLIFSVSPCIFQFNN